MADFPLLNEASLVMIPGATKEGKVYSQVPTDGSGDFTFTRSTTATRVNEAGNIEKGYENLLYPSNNLTSLCSNNFNGTASDSNQIANPVNGEVTADKLYTIVSGTSENRARISGYIQNGVQTISMYAKYIDYKYLYIRQLASSNNQEAIFDIELGEITFDNLLIESKIEPAGNGWYRCSITFNASSISNNLIDIGLSGSATAFRGNVQDGVEMYFFGYMLNQGLVAYPYLETTTAPVYGGLQSDQPRLDYTDATCPSLLLEPSRTNVLPYSEYFQNWFTNATLTSNYGISPEGVRNSTRVNYSGNNQYLAIGFQGVAGTGSIYVKGVSGETINIGAGSAAGGSLHTLNGDWQRVSFYDDGTSPYFSVNTYFGTARDIEVFGAQVEQNASYPTSYIPTYGSAQTRGADTQSQLTIPNGSATEGTIFYEFDKAQASASFDIVPLKVGTNRILRISQYNPNMRFSINENATSYNESNSYNSHIKVAVSYSSSSVKLFINGVLRATDTTYSASGNVIIPANGLQATNIGCSIESKQLLYFPKALTDTECIALTTL